MSDAMFGSGADHWVCPSDRQLALRAKLQTGWSVHTFRTERQRRSQTLDARELDIIVGVIQRAEQLDQAEQRRIGRLVERLENMRRSAVGNGLSQCLLCGEFLGLLGTSSVLCQDCSKKVCTKCGIETACSQKRTQWLCKICSEQREVWKRSGAWFYKAVPKYVWPMKEATQGLGPGLSAGERGGLPVGSSASAGRTYSWARSKVVSSDSDSDSEVSESSQESKAFVPMCLGIPDVKQRDDSRVSRGLAEASSSLSSKPLGIVLSESHSSLGSDRNGVPAATDDDDTDCSRPSLSVQHAVSVEEERGVSATSWVVRNQCPRPHSRDRRLSRWHMARFPGRLALTNESPRRTRLRRRLVAIVFPAHKSITSKWRSKIMRKVAKLGQKAVHLDDDDDMVQKTLRFRLLG
uniref:Double C2 domain beta n=1 Tax=Scleropages formosus TaxID=113540 RepID=A0A8C9UYZ8_SCLFO